MYCVTALSGYNLKTPSPVNWSELIFFLNQIILRERRGVWINWYVKWFVNSSWPLSTGSLLLQISHHPFTHCRQLTVWPQGGLQWLYCAGSYSPNWLSVGVCVCMCKPNLFGWQYRKWSRCRSSWSALSVWSHNFFFSVLSLMPHSVQVHISSWMCAVLKPHNWLMNSWNGSPRKSCSAAV